MRHPIIITSEGRILYSQIMTVSTRGIKPNQVLVWDGTKLTWCPQDITSYFSPLLNYNGNNQVVIEGDEEE